MTRGFHIRRKKRVKRSPHQLGIFENFGGNGWHGNRRLFLSSTQRVEKRYQLTDNVINSNFLSILLFVAAQNSMVAVLCIKCTIM